MERATIIKLLVVVILAILTGLNETYGLNMPSTELTGVSGLLAGFIAGEMFGKKAKAKEAGSTKSE